MIVRVAPVVRYLKRAALPSSRGFFRSLLAALVLVPLVGFSFVVSSALPAYAAAPSCGPSSFVVTPVYNPTFYTAFSTTPSSNSVFVGYSIQDLGSPTADFWAQIGNFTGGYVSLSPSETPNHELGVLAPDSAPASAYFLVTASGLTPTPAPAQNHSLTIYSGNPSSGGTAVCVYNTNAGVTGGGGFTSVQPTIVALANKVTSVTSPVEAGAPGSTFNLVATGQTGTIGAGPSGSYDVNLNPITNSAWPAAQWQLVGVSMSYAAGPTFTNQLWLQNQAAYAGNYTATFTFKVISQPSVGGVVSPIEEIASGTQMKHNAVGSFPPVLLGQTITFNPLSPVPATPTSITLGATTSSGLTVSYSTSSSSSICTISGNTVNVVGTGDCQITASQSGNSVYGPATPVTQTLVIGSPSQLTLQYEPNSADSGSVPVSSYYTSGATATVSSNAGLLGRTGYTLYGWNTSQSGTGTEYATGATFTITSNTSLYAMWAQNQTIPFYPMAPVYQGSSPLTLPSTSTAGLTVTYTTSASPSVCTVSGNVVTIKDKSSKTDACPITATQSGSTVYPFVNPATTVVQNIYILPTGTFAVYYSANGATSGTVPVDTNAYTSASTVTVAANTGALSRTGYTFIGWNTAPNSSGAPYAASGSATFSITASTTLYAVWALNQTITFASIPSQTWTAGTLSLPLNASASSGLPVSFTSSGPCSITGTTLSITGTGSCVITASQAGSSSYPFVNAATPVSQTVTISAATTVTLTFDANSTNTLALTGSTPTGSAPSPVSLNTTSGFSTTVPGAGTMALSGYTFQGWNTDPYLGGTLYTPGSTLTVEANTTLYAQWIENQSITFPAPASVNVSAGSTTLTATASSGLLITYTTTSSSSICTISGSIVTLVGAGNCVITASQGGDADYTPATPVTQTLVITSSTATDTISFNSEGGSVVSSVSGPDGSSITLPPAPTYPGYTFNGWFAAASGGSALTSPYTLAGSTTLFAQWTANPVAITYISVTFLPGIGQGPSVTIDNPSGTMLYLPTPSTGVTAAITPPAGYAFTGWTSSACPAVISQSITPTQSLTLIACYTSKTPLLPQVIIPSHSPASAIKISNQTSYTITAIPGASGNPLVYSIDASSTAGCSVDPTSGVVSLDGRSGICVVDINQSGNLYYLPSAQVRESLNFVYSPTPHPSSKLVVNSYLRPLLMNQVATVAQLIRVTRPIGSKVLSVSVGTRHIPFTISNNGDVYIHQLQARGTLVKVTLDISGSLYNTTTYISTKRFALSNINFSFAQYSLTSSAKHALIRDASIIRSMGIHHLSLLGFTDVLASAGFSNQRLSVQRASATSSFLRSLLKNYPIAITYQGLSSTHPVVNSLAPSARALNRRVEIFAW